MMNRLTIDIPDNIAEHPDGQRMKSVLGDMAVQLALGRVEFNLDTIVQYLQHAELPIRIQYEQKKPVE